MQIARPRVQILASLGVKGRIELPEAILKRARLPIERMLQISAKPLENAG